MKRLLLAVVAGLALPVVWASPASAHPLGNFSVNHASRLVVAPEEVRVEHVVDLAEIPTFQARTAMDADGSGQPSPGEVEAWGRERCAALVPEVTLTAGGSPVPLSLVSGGAAFRPGQGGLPTTRITCTLTGPVTLGDATELRYAERTDVNRRGWHEVTAVGDGATLTSSDVPEDSPSDSLTAYPDELLAQPLDVRSAALVARPGGPRAGGGASAVVDALPRGADRLTLAFTGLVERRDLGLGVGLVAALVAVGLGCLHALAPGHGKTVMAAYLVGQRGTRRQALWLGATVTITHTVGVLLLGLMLTATTLASPEKAVPALEALSGVLLAAVGLYLLRGAVRRRRAGLPLLGHTHGPGGHTHGPGGHTHGPGGHSHGPDEHGHGPHEHGHGPDEHTHGPGGHSHGAAEHAHEHGDDPGTDDHPHSDPHRHEPGDDRLSRPGGGTGRRGAGTVAAPAGTALLDAPAAGAAHDHDHEHGHHHEHALGHDRGQEPRHGAERRERPLGRGTLAAMGIAGGLVPSPSALVVLLGATALGRAWFGVLLVVAYGVGMAVTLTAAGLLLLRARAALDRRAWGAGAGRRALAVGQLVPVLTAGLIVVVGTVLIVRGASLLG